MTAQKFVRKTFRKARRKVCRYIVSFDRCPTSYRKSYKDIILNALACSGLCIVGVVFMMCLMLFA
jgi:hypothetical protein